MTARITVVGSINMDLVIQSKKIPHPGETIIGGDLQTYPGGKGANQAVAAARLGGEVTMVGQVGQDVFAGRLKDNLAASGVSLSHIGENAQAASGVAFIVVDEAGQNSIVVAPGANYRLAPADVDLAAAVIASSDVMLLQLEIPLDTVFRAAQVARQHGTKVILNPAPAQPLSAELLALVDILIPNESETVLLTGLPAGNQREIEAAAARLQATGVGAVILTLGKRGATLAQAGQALLFPAFAVDRVVDTTAAGDAFVGGLAVAVGEGKSLPEAIAWGNAAGAVAVTRAGAQPSLPNRQEVEALLRQAGPDQLHGIVMER